MKQVNWLHKSPERLQEISQKLVIYKEREKEEKQARRKDERKKEEDKKKEEEAIVEVAGRKRLEVKKD